MITSSFQRALRKSISFYRQWERTASSDGITRKLSMPPACFTFHFLFHLLVINHSTSVQLHLEMTKETKGQGLEKEMATHSSILAWRIPWTEEPGGLLFVGSQRAGHNWVTKPHMHAVYRENGHKASSWMFPGWKQKGVRNEAENYNIIVLESQETAQLLGVLKLSWMQQRNEDWKCCHRAAPGPPESSH